MEVAQGPAAIGVGDKDPQAGIVAQHPSIDTLIGKGLSQLVCGGHLTALHSEPEKMGAGVKVDRVAIIETGLEKGMCSAALAHARHYRFDIAVVQRLVPAETLVYEFHDIVERPAAIGSIADQHIEALPQQLTLEGARTAFPVSL